LIGFISGISKALADEGIPIFVVSAYSTDHVFVKNEYLDRAVKVLNKLEFKITSINRTENKSKTDYIYQINYSVKNTSPEEISFFLNS
jgi:hypothetical protein